jgi:hypothetical protein
VKCTVWCVGIDVGGNIGASVFVHTMDAAGSFETPNVMDQTARGLSQKTVRYLQLLTYYFHRIM